MDRTKEKAEYASIYGTSPCACQMCFSTFDKPETYLGSRIENKTIVFMFNALTLNDSLNVGNVIEHHFRCRLSRKVSMNFGTNMFSVPFPCDTDELGDYMTAMFDLELYFQGLKMSPRLTAELKIFKQGEDWRNTDLVQEKMLLNSI